MRQDKTPQPDDRAVVFDGYTEDLAVVFDGCTEDHTHAGKVTASAESRRAEGGYIPACGVEGVGDTGETTGHGMIVGARP